MTVRAFSCLGNSPFRYIMNILTDEIKSDNTPGITGDVC